MTAQVVVVPEHAPPHPENVEPAAGAAVSVTARPARVEVEHVAPQSMPAGDEVTVPLPLPCLATVNAYSVDAPKRGHGSSSVPSADIAAEYVRETPPTVVKAPPS